MTIREIERRSGLDRTNIRFYEREGLIAPVRHENGYRDYSDDDLQLLLKIKLFRRLGFSLDAIRAMKDDDEAMERVLTERLAAIGTERRQLDAAEQVCQALRADGARFSTLDAQQYLDSFDRVLRQPSARAVIADAVPATDRYAAPSCPIRRYFARTLDMGLPNLLIIGFLAVICRANLTGLSSFITFLLNFLSALCWVFIEPLLLSRFGTTPGKWLLGIRVEHVDGRHLRYGEALDRTWTVFGRGMGYCIPIFNVWRSWKCFQSCSDYYSMEWEEDSVLVVQEYRHRQAIRYIGAEVLLFLLTALLILAPWMPPNRGELTVDEFVENYNTTAKFHDLDMLVLGSDGQLTENRGASENYLVLSLEEGALPRLNFTTEDGILTGISFARQAESKFGGLYVDRVGKVAVNVCTYAFALADSNMLTALPSLSKLEAFSELESGKIEADIAGCHLVYTITPLEDTTDESGLFLTHQNEVFFSITHNP